MSVERRKARQANPSKLMPEACADGPFKGYIGIDRISLATRKFSENDRMTTLMHHFHTENLRAAFRQCKGNKAVGVDQITKSEYGKDLQQNLERLSYKIANGGWRPKPSRQVLIPKPQGGTRPLAVGCLEDKLVQTLTAKILEAVLDPSMDRHSFGFRSGRSTHQALAKLYSEIKKRGKDCVVVEMDIEKYFDSINQDLLMQMLEKKISDPFFLRHMRRVLRNSILLPSGENLLSEMGSPQGNPASPVLANIYLHYALDKWFRTHWSKYAEIIRYADDAVFVFSDLGKAREFRTALEERLSEFGLKLNADKSGLRKFGPADQAHDLPFVGFALYWGKQWFGRKYLKAKTLPKRLGRCIQAFKVWIKTNRHRYKLNVLWGKIKAKLIGHYNYYGVSTNLKKLSHYYHACVGLTFKWLNRRSQKKSFTWEKFMRRIMFNPLPKPSVGSIVIDLTTGLGSKLKRKPRSRMRKSRTYGSQRSGGQQCPLFT